MIKKIFKHFGYELRKHYKIDVPTATSSLINIINRYDIDTILDVGANIGQFAKEIHLAGFSGEIHSFEPVLSTYKKLEDNSRDNHNWHIYNLALGADMGTMEINVMGTSDLSSFFTPTEYGKKRYKHLNLYKNEVVTVDTVDNFLSKNNMQKRNILLKMDTQGYDLEVIKGARNSLNYILALQSEIALVPLYEGMPHYLEALRQYEIYGYAIAGLYPVSRKESLAIIEMDCQMVKNIQREYL